MDGLWLRYAGTYWFFLMTRVVSSIWCREGDL